MAGQRRHATQAHIIYYKVEIKKSDKANIERVRATGFLIGLIVVLSVLYVALEFKSADNGPDTSAQQFEDLTRDLDMLPAVDRSEMTAAAPAPTRPTASKLNVVDKAKSDIEKQAAINDLRTNPGDGDATQASDEGQAASNAVPPVAVDADDNPLSTRVVEQIPEFPGGMVELMKWLTKTLHYPYWAQKRQIEGRVVVTFIINRDGSLANIQVAKSVDPLLDNEALRVVRLMPKWKPGMQDSKPCRTMFAIPIEFKL